MSQRRPIRCKEPGCRAVLAWALPFEKVELAPGVGIKVTLSTGRIEVWCPVCGAHRELQARGITLQRRAPVVD